MARGRPRKFDENSALAGAMLVFWEKGLSATSLDDLTIGMKMNRPSIYNAFGNKDEIYRRALAMFCGQLDVALSRSIESGLEVSRGFVAFFDDAIDVYCDDDSPLGCLMICTAPAAALSHEAVGDDLRALINQLDRRFEQRLKQAAETGELIEPGQARLAAKLLQATLHTLALRARAGESRASLRKLARYSVSVIISDRHVA